MLPVFHPGNRIRSRCGREPPFYLAVNLRRNRHALLDELIAQSPEHRERRCGTSIPFLIRSLESSSGKRQSHRRYDTNQEARCKPYGPTFRFRPTRPQIPVSGSIKQQSQSHRKEQPVAPSNRCIHATHEISQITRKEITVPRYRRIICPPIHQIGNQQNIQ